MTSRIPITLITGYLGAGKTTLINHLLSSAHGRRIAVLVNDFGAVNIDAALIIDQDEQAISLANGCVCCSITDDLGAALDAQTDRDVPPELIVLEASGVAEPLRIARHAGNWPGFELDGILTILDAETVRGRSADKFVGQLVKNQVMAGDILIMNKIDLVPKDECDQLKDWIAQLAPAATIVEAIDGQVDPALLIGLPAHRTEYETSMPARVPNIFHSRHWVPPGPLDENRLAECLAQFPPSVHRVKGFFRTAETGDLMLLQRVGRRWTVEKAVATGHADVGFVLIAVGAMQDLDQATVLLNSASE